MNWLINVFAAFTATTLVLNIIFERSFESEVSVLSPSVHLSDRVQRDAPSNDLAQSSDIAAAPFSIMRSEDLAPQSALAVHDQGGAVEIPPISDPPPQPIVVAQRERPVPTHPKFIKYLEKCQRNPDEIRIKLWMGRSGNHLEQLVMAFAIAIFSGRPYVVTPTWLDDVWNMNETRIAVADPWEPPPTSIAPLSESCVDFRGMAVNGVPNDCTFIFDTRCETTVADRRDIFVRQIRPLLQPDVFSACEVPSKETVVIHIRDGDASFDVGSSHAQPPCEYFHRVIETGNRGRPFTKVLLVHSHEDRRENVCIADIKARHGNKLLGPDLPSTILHDTCVCLHATNLAVTSSGFGVSLAMINTQLDKLFVVDAVSSILDQSQPKLHPDAWSVLTLPRKIDDFELNVDQLCAVFPHAMHYRVPMDGTIVAVAQALGSAAGPKVDSDANRKKYFLNFREFSSLVETNCSKRTV